MNKFDFAASVIKASPLARLTDRAFAVPVFFVCVVWIAALSSKTSFDQAIDFTKYVLGTFILAEKGKDAITSYGALTGGTAQSVAVGSVSSDAVGSVSSDAALPAPVQTGVQEGVQTVTEAPVSAGAPVETFDVGGML